MLPRQPRRFILATRPNAIFVAGKSGSSLPQSSSSRRYITHSIDFTNFVTHRKKKVLKVLLNFVLTSRILGDAIAIRSHALASSRQLHCRAPPSAA